MKIKHHEIGTSVENPFVNCKLAREPYARVLTDIVNTYADGFVMAINNEWGTGKTTFVKMWQQQLEKEGFKTIYFNAWENDFDSNPLIALMSELKTLTKENNKELYKSVIKKGAVLIKNVAPALFRAVANKYIASEIIAEAIENATIASAEIFEEEVKEYSKRKQTITDFRDELGNFIKAAENPKPVVFIIDELDRCRPDYSVEVLEKIKHFFSVPGIVFALAIDKEHLSSSIRGYYGSEKINTEEYLRRFIDLEYSLPKPQTKAYIQYLVEYYSFRELLRSTVSTKAVSANLTLKSMTLMAEVIFVKSKPTLRQQEKVFALFRIVTCSFRNFANVESHLLFLLTYMRVCRSIEFAKLNEGTMKDQSLIDLFAELMPTTEHEQEQLNLANLECVLLYLYYNKIDPQKVQLILNATILDWSSVGFQCRFVQKFSDLRINFESCRRRFAEMNINFLLDKVNLLEPLDFN